MPVITVTDLGKTFVAKEKASGLRGSLRALVRPRTLEVHAVRDISFTVDEGERVAFIGPNGAGKSTTIKMLVGILFPTTGQAQVLDYVPWRQREKLAYHIGAVFGQKSQLWYHLPPQDTFDLLASIYELDDAVYRRRLARLVDLFELTPYLHTPVRKLSLGERMRCEIAASLIHGPRILFLDEPTIGLDVVVKARIRDLILQLNQEERITVFLTSHDVGDMETLCRRAMVINHGEVIYDGKVSALKRSYIRSKTVSLKLGQPFEGFEMAGVQVAKHKGYGVRLEVDTDTVPIDAVMTRLLERYSVVDLNVDNPPMEAIIARIYQEGPPTENAEGET
ncbi:MAG: ATP-binding cassette domain-containing protein [Chloroflexi bacterium]|nr:ATP-binding cassette domain-containing protein [Chloroflexota bacterium]MBU1748768.1 ATP-binding cassette domain-containing protein [Chloroflexota bacterium]MBU1879437.1 ATP-binding cassette domain-containing protein [Chloroflexota bacterium]